MIEPADCLAATEFLDHGHPAVQALVANTGTHGDARERAVRLYYAVRDGLRYDPYAIRLRRDTYRASYVLGRGRGYCSQKSIVYAAACRGAGIPARLGYADVRNHLSTERLARLLGTDVYIWHGYAEVWLDERWVKATPVFNLSLCEKFHVLPLEFDGREDSLYQAYDAKGRRHLEYVHQRGAYTDVPFEAMTADMAARYPAYFAELEPDGDFEAEAARETLAAAPAGTP